MKNLKTKLTGMLLTLILLVGLISLMAIPATASPGNVLYFDPTPAGVSGCGESVDVKIMAESDVAIIATQLVFTFDTTCLNITNTVGNTADWKGGVTFSSNYNTTGEITITSTVGLNPAIPAGTVEIATLTLECMNCDGCTSALEWTLGKYTNSSYATVYPDPVDGSFSCEAAAPPFNPVLISGTASIVPQDEFAPGEDIYVWGTGFVPDQDYMIYIEPYVAGAEVFEGQALNPAGGAPLGYAPIIVPAAGDGTLGPAYLATPAPGNFDTYWEIVADDLSGSAGIYNAAEDGLDAIALEEYGFHIVPEALTIILLGAGLAGLGSYMAVRRRKTASREA
jgi:hypothetical protein